MFSEMPRNGVFSRAKRLPSNRKRQNREELLRISRHPPDGTQNGGAASKRNLSALQHGWAVCRLFAVSANSFERAVLRRLFSDCREKSTSPVIVVSVSNFPLKINVPGSRPTLPSGNFNRARKRHGISVAPSPLCLQRLARRSCWRCLIEQEKRAFAVALGVKSQRTAFAGRKM
jgi:hypothetical protein